MDDAIPGPRPGHRHPGGPAHRHLPPTGGDRSLLRAGLATRLGLAAALVALLWLAVFWAIR